MCLSVTNHVNYSCELYHVKRYNGHVFVNLFLAFCENVWKKAVTFILYFIFPKILLNQGLYQYTIKINIFLFLGSITKK